MFRDTTLKNTKKGASHSEFPAMDKITASKQSRSTVRSLPKFNLLVTHSSARYAVTWFLKLNTNHKNHHRDHNTLYNSVLMSKQLRPNFTWCRENFEVTDVKFPMLRNYRCRMKPFSGGDSEEYICDQFFSKLKMVKINSKNGLNNDITECLL